MTMLKQMNSVATDWAALPIVMTVEEMRAVLRIGNNTAYHLMAEPGFPRVKIGKTDKIYRDGLRRYLEGHIDMIEIKQNKNLEGVNHG